METIIRRKVCRHTDGTSELSDDSLALEKKVRISVNDREIISLYCTPLMIRELVVGLLMTEGIIQGNWCADRMGIEYGDEIRVNIPAEGEVSMEGKTVTSGCVGGITFDKKIESGPIHDAFTINKADLKNIYGEFQRKSELYKITGCIHSAALSDGRSLICFAEDIGRHNAVDKVIGYAVLEHIPLSGKLLLASGRISSEIATKCSRWGIPLLVTRTAPTHLAVEIAERMHVTLVGFMRGNRFNVYTHPERIGR
ncbi:MAG TPA: formate dehydrogenase accessory sulfurtransferase FdhD [Thermodesulfovibrionales bacterium]|nr:formate dehydrogenase accessory sulfurtransferase FdhD [Thermodesulfovibrionales bacterium]